MIEEKKVLFDPGYAPLVVESIGQVGYIYYTFCAINAPKLRRINFPHTLRKLISNIKINAGFYLGCLLWASYIAQFDDYKIEGNQLLGEVVTEDEYTNEIKFLIELSETKINKDSKTYTGKPFELDKRFINIFKTYKEFLILNNGFVNCSKTNQIILPKNLKKPSKEGLDKIYTTIQETISNQDITRLFNCYEEIF